MAQAHYRSGKRLIEKRSYVFPLLAFLVPFLVRVVPEILMGQFAVGFDPMGYYVPNTLLWLRNGVELGLLLSSAPLLYLIMMGSTSVGIPIVVFLKILGPVLLGLLGLLIYKFSETALKWSNKKSLLVTLVATLYFVALRISWDMFRSELALIFLFTILLLLNQTGHEKRNCIVMSVLMVLVVLTHQLVTVILFAIIIAMLLKQLFKKQNRAILKIFLASIPAIILFAAMVYLSYFVFDMNYSGGVNLIGGTAHLELIIDTLGYLVFCYLPLAPLLIFTVRHFKGDFPLKVWMAWLSIPIILAVIVPNGFLVGGVLPYRWVLLLTYPLSFYVVEGITRIKWNSYKILVGLTIVLLSTSFMVLPNSNALTYFSVYTQYGPTSMLENTLQLSDCQDTQNALQWAQENLPPEGRLMVHEAFYGWAVLNFDNDRLEPYFFENLTDVTLTLEENNATSSLFLIWWVNGQGWYCEPTVPLQFSEIHHSGNIAIYQYLSIK